MDTFRPAYADFDPPAKFQAIEGIIATRLRQHPKAVCSYSGGSDSDILLDLIEKTRSDFPSLPKVKYVFFDTGLEMTATREHVKAAAEKYNVEIETIRPKVNIVQAVRQYGIPFLSKTNSLCLGEWQKNPFPLSVVKEFEKLESREERTKMFDELAKKYPKIVLEYFLSCKPNGDAGSSRQFSIMGYPYLVDFLAECPPDFTISKKCCDYCKKEPAHRAQKGYELVITGEREAEGGLRTAKPRNMGENDTMCFREHQNGQFRLKPLFYVSNADKAWYKENYGIRYSDAYEVYGLKRTGCCGCPISAKAVKELEAICPFEPQLVKAAYNVFDKSYEYRQRYNEYKAMRREREKQEKILQDAKGGYSDEQKAY